LRLHALASAQARCVAWARAAAVDNFRSQRRAQHAVAIIRLWIDHKHRGPNHGSGVVLRPTHTQHADFGVVFRAGRGALESGLGSNTHNNSNKQSEATKKESVHTFGRERSHNLIKLLI